MANVLVVANETLGATALAEAVRRRARQGGAHFVVIAPQTRPRSGYVVYDESVRDAAEHRINLTIAQLREVGVDAEGHIMDPDPFTAVADAVAEHHIDEIIISTHPETRSGWLRRGLVDRVRESTGLPVEHVVVDLERERGAKTHTLVVANQTVRGEPLFRLLREKAQKSPHFFTVIVPQAGGDGAAAGEARRRLAAVLERMRAEGLDASGGIGPPDPYNAIVDALQAYPVDEIVISTLPARRSGWLRGGLVERVQRVTACPVDHVVGDVEHEPAGTPA